MKRTMLLLTIALTTLACASDASDIREYQISWTSPGHETSTQPGVIHEELAYSRVLDLTVEHSLLTILAGDLPRRGITTEVPLTQTVVDGKRCFDYALERSDFPMQDCWVTSYSVGNLCFSEDFASVIGTYSVLSIFSLCTSVDPFNTRQYWSAEGIKVSGE